MSKFVIAAIVVGLTGAGFVSGSIAADRKVDIINKTGMQLKHFHASNTGTNDWEEDILGRDVLDDGETFEANIDDGTGACKFDFKGTFVSGQELIKRNVDVCQISTFTFTR